MESIEDLLFLGFESRNAELLRQAVVNTLLTGGHECLLHPLGFYFVRLAARERKTIRLHYWPANDREKGTAITPYHDHVWSLCSCILLGVIENVLLQLVSDETGKFQMAQIHQTGNVDEVIPVSSRVNLQVESREVHRAGSFYEIAPRVFHYSDVPVGQATVTVVLAEVIVEGGPRTLVPAGTAGHMPTRKPIGAPERVLGEVCKAVSECRW